MLRSKQAIQRAALIDVLQCAALVKIVT